MAYRIALATDHGGFKGKNELRDALAADGHEVMDCGTYESDSTDYPIYAARMAKAVSQGRVDFGVLLCRSGIGMSMVANRFRGVRAALANSVSTAAVCRSHNDANVLVMGNDYMDASFKELADVFLSTEFDGGRHARRVGQIDIIDDIIDSHHPAGHSCYHDQSVWSANLAGDEPAEEFSPTTLRGYVLTFDRLSELLKMGMKSVAECLNGSSSVEEKIDALMDHEIRRTAEALQPISLISDCEDGRVVVPVPLDSNSGGASIIEKVTACGERWSEFDLAYSIEATTAGTDAAFHLLKKGYSIVLTGIQLPEKAGKIFERFSETVTELTSNRACLYIQMEDNAATTVEFAAMLHASRGFDKMGEAYKRGLPTPILIREGDTLNDQYIPASKFLLNAKSGTISRDESLSNLKNAISKL